MVTHANLLPLMALSFFVVGLAMASEGEMYVWFWPCPAMYCWAETLKRGMAFSSMLCLVFSDDWDFVGEHVFGERSASAPAEGEVLLGDIV